MNKLVVRPLIKPAISTVIVIDVLDECKGDEPASAILSILGQFVAAIPRVKFFVTGLLKNQAMVSSVCSSVIHERSDLVTYRKVSDKIYKILCELTTIKGKK